jgi:hypothetical protein
MPVAAFFSAVRLPDNISKARIDRPDHIPAIIQLQKTKKHQILLMHFWWSTSKIVHPSLSRKYVAGVIYSGTTIYTINTRKNTNRGT